MRDNIASSHVIPIAVVFLAWSCFAPLHAAEPIHSVSVIPVRDYGIVMGEIMTVEIRVAVEPGYELETATLPQAGSAITDYLELHKTHWTRQSGNNETVYRLTLNYQVFKGVREPETLTVPALPLSFRHAGQTAETQAPAWNFTLMPIIPARTIDEEVILRGDSPPPIYSSTGHWRWFLASLAGGLSLIAYAIRRLGLHTFRRNTSPFARAAFGLKQLGRHPPDIVTLKQGTKLVHDALNETAGHILFSNQLGRFLSAQPQYAPLESELEQFFDLSDRLFFEGVRECPADYPLPRLDALCRQLAAVGRNGR